METFILLLKSAVAGFIVAVPIGAIGAMCLRRALHGRWAMGLVTGLGAAAADSLLATAAMFGLTLLTRYIFANRTPVLLVGGVFLLGVGIRMILKRRPKPIKADEDEPVAGDRLRRWRKLGTAIATGFALTIVNPATFLAFVGVFAGLGLFQDRPAGLLAAWVVVLGVFLGSMSWWSVLTATAFTVRRHLSLGVITVLNAVLGLIVVGFGAASLLTVAGVEI